MDNIGLLHKQRTAVVVVTPSLQTGLELSKRLRSLPFAVFGQVVAAGWRCAAVRLGARYEPVYSLVEWPEVQDRWRRLLTIQSASPSLPMFVSHHWTPKALLDPQDQLGAWVTPLYVVRSPELQWTLTLAFGNSDGCYPAALPLAETIREVTATEAR